MDTSQHETEKPPIHGVNSEDEDYGKNPRHLWPKGTAIKKLREDHDPCNPLTQTIIAEKIESSQRFISQAENEKRMCDAATLQRLANFFGVHLSDIAHTPNIFGEEARSDFGSYANVVRFVNGLCESDTMPASFKELQDLVNSNTAETKLEQFCKASDAAKNRAWNLFHEDGWKQLYFGDAEAEMSRWLVSSELLQELKYLLHKRNALFNSLKMPVTEDITNTTPDNVAPRFLLMAMISNLWERKNYLNANKPKNLEEVDSFCEYLLSFDIGLNTLTRSAGPMLVELHQQIAKIFRYAAVVQSDEHFSPMLPQLIDFAITSRANEIHYYESLRTGTIGFQSFFAMINYYKVSATLVQHAILMQSLSFLDASRVDGGVSAPEVGIQPSRDNDERLSDVHQLWCCDSSEEYRDFIASLWEFFVRKDLGERPVWS